MATHFSVILTTFLLSVSLLPSVIHGQATPFAGSWSRTTAAPTARDLHGMTCDADGVTIFGGRTALGEITSTMYRFAPSTSTWTRTYFTGSIGERYGGSLQRVGSGAATDSLYWLMGYPTTNAPSPSAEVWRFDAGTNHWSVASSTAPFTPRGNFSSVTVGTAIVVFGGSTEATFASEAWSFETTTSTWAQLHNGTGTAPTARGGLCCAYFATRQLTLCHGGQTRRGASAELWAFNHATNTWALLNRGDGTGVPGARRDASCAAHTASLFVVAGGWLPATNNFADNATVWAWNLDTSSWSAQAQPTGGAAYFHSAPMCSHGGSTFLMGGAGPQSTRTQGVAQITGSGTLTQITTRAGTSPEGRWGHTAAIVGNEMVVAFGTTGTTRLADIWFLNLESMIWSQGPQGDTASGLPKNGDVLAREGASVVVRGPIMYFYGGVLPAGNYSDEIAVFDTSTRVAPRILEPVPLIGIGCSTSGFRRAYHSAAMHNGRMVVVGGVVDNPSASTCSPYISAFDFTLNVWLKIGITAAPGTPIPDFPRSHSTIVADAMEDQLVVFGGFASSSTLDDAFRLRLTFNTTGHYAIAQIISVPTTDGSLAAEQLVRGGHAAAGIGRHIFLCGGAVTRSQPTQPSDFCLQHNLDTGLRSLVAAPPIDFSLTEGSAVYFGRRVIFFGGRLGRDGLFRNVATNEMLTFEVSTAGVCSAGAADDAACIHCSAGTQNPGCTSAAAGTYTLTGNTGAVTPCPAGTFSNVAAARSEQNCLPCPDGSESLTAGATACSLCGASCASVSIAERNAFRGTNSRSISQPPTYVVPSLLPIMYWPMVAVLSAAFFIITVTLCVGCHVDRLDRDFFFSEDNLLMLQKVYIRFCSVDDDRGMDENLMFMALNGHEFVHTDKFDNSLVASTFRSMNNGCGFVSFDEFLAIIAELVYFEALAPLPGSQAEDKPQGCLWRFFRNRRYVNIDLYSDEHRMGRDGEGIRIQKTRCGGIITFLFGTFALLLVAAMVLAFWYQSEFENTAQEPAIKYRDRQFSTRMNLTITAIGGTTNRSQCIEPGTTDTCSALMRILAVGNEPFVAQSFIPFFLYSELTALLRDPSYAALSRRLAPADFTCVYVPDDRSCAVRMDAKAAYMPPGSEIAVSAFFHPDLFAYAFEYELTVDSGVLDGTDTSDTITHPSSAKVRISSPSANSVFTGWPPPILEAQLFPSVFTKQPVSPPYYERPLTERVGHLVYGVEPLLDRGNTGFVQVKGNAVPRSQVPGFAGLTTQVKLVVGEDVIRVTRQRREASVEFATGLLGAVAGLSSAMVIVMKTIESLLRIHERKDRIQRKKRMSEVLTNIYEPTLGSSTKQDASQTPSLVGDQPDQHLVQPLVQGGMPFAAAVSTLALIRTHDGGSGLHSNSPGKELNTNSSPVTPFEPHSFDEDAMPEVGAFVSPKGDDAPRSKPPKAAKKIVRRDRF